MGGNHDQPGWGFTGLFAGLLLGLLPAAVSADTAVFRNECSYPLILQASHVHRGMLRRDQFLLRCGETSPRLSLDSDKLVVITDSKTGRVLFREAVKASRTPVQYSIVADRATGRVRLLSHRSSP